MISYLSGTTRQISTHAHHNQISLIVNNIGFAVQTPRNYSIQIGSPIELEIYAHTTQENGTQLFGFKTQDEKDVFTLILNCSGIGPKIGLSVLADLTPGLFVSAILSNDIQTLSSVDGIGKKKAENIILQLKDKIEKLVLESNSRLSARSDLKDQSSYTSSQTAQNFAQLNQALNSLGYSRQEITQALDYVKQEQNNKTIEITNFQDLLKTSLMYLAKNLSR